MPSPTFTMLFSSLLILTCVASEAISKDGPAEPSAATGEKDDLKPLNKQGTVLLDARGKKLLLKSEVVLREGLLELLVCLKQSKEHESILSVNTQAKVVHAGLLALSAELGSPVRWQPEYQPAKGQQIDIYFTWTDESGK